MKYYSDITKKFYDNSEDCLAAEREFLEAQKKDEEIKKQKAAERKIAAEKVDAARQNLKIAQSAYREALEAFCKQYGSYHTTVAGNDIPTLFDVFNIFGN